MAFRIGIRVCNERDALKARIEKLEAKITHASKDLRMIQAACGAPDAADACRRIIRYADETITALQKGDEDV